ncbi:stress responsive A/B barrel domain protein [Rhizodiscina lignyota]|uniref:Stress responsive A/B barrel domain protein n=1 Tax=Rhizodiscina lignyota TaxID=1504668 RepID=A0A9P4I639_9PEZI|nr:stress responsive A/B barrel domain protein [Rhizodiscina lignyota]
MGAYRIVLIRLKQGVTEEQKAEFIRESKKLLDNVPGLLAIEVGPPTDMERTKGFDMGVFLTLSAAEDLDGFAKHPEHLRMHEIRTALSEDTLAFNLSF